MLDTLPFKDTNCPWQGLKLCATNLFQMNCWISEILVLKTTNGCRLCARILFTFVRTVGKKLWLPHDERQVAFYRAYVLTHVYYIGE